MRNSNSLFSHFRTTLTLLTAGVIFAGVAACSNVTDFSSDEDPTIPEKASSSEVIPESSIEGDLQLDGDLVLTAPIKPALKPAPVKPKIKGTITLGSSGDAKPLYIIDGVKFSSFELSDIEPRSIESIEVLRGAAAKAIYGAQAKDGAVIVTKKDEDRD